MPKRSDEPEDFEELEELPDSEEERPAAPRRGVRRTRGRHRGARPRGGHGPAQPRGRVPLLLALVAGVLVVAFVALRGGGSSSSPEKTGSGETAASKETAKEPTPKELFAEKRDALAPDDVAGRKELVTLAMRAGLEREAHALRREILLLDPDDDETRRALGFERYEGPVQRLRGRWLNADERKRAARLESLFTEEHEGAQTGVDVFLKAAGQKVAEMRDEFPESRWAAFYGPGRMRVPFVVLVERTPNADVEAYRSEYEELLTTLYEAFFSRYRERFQLEDIEQPVVVVIFDSVKTYSDHRNRHPEGGYQDPSFIGGYYQPATQRLIFWRQPILRNVLLHEGAHMLIHYAFSGRGFVDANESPWFQEGFAEFFGGCRVVRENGARRYVLGQRLPHREAELQFLEQNGQRLPVLDLVKIDHFRFAEAKRKQADASLPPEERQAASALISNVYAEGWALIMYLNWADGGALRDVFDSYFEAEVKGAGHWGTLGELLGLENEEDWKRFDDRFLVWTQTKLRKL